MTTFTPTSTTGPDLTHCGQVIEWQDRVTLDPKFIEAAAVALTHLEFEVELARWSPDDPIVSSIVAWWNGQRSMLRRHLAVQLHDSEMTFVVHRRTDQGDGMMKGYVRIEGGETA